MKTWTTRTSAGKKSWGMVLLMLGISCVSPTRILTADAVTPHVAFWDQLDTILGKCDVMEGATRVGTSREGAPLCSYTPELIHFIRFSIWTDRQNDALSNRHTPIQRPE